jgi:hypothetical protein
MKTAKQHNAGQLGESEARPDPKTEILLRFFKRLGVEVRTVKAKKLRAIKRTKSKLP